VPARGAITSKSNCRLNDFRPLKLFREKQIKLLQYSNFKDVIGITEANINWVALQDGNRPFDNVEIRSSIHCL
jgi:hypothetical protein